MQYLSTPEFAKKLATLDPAAQRDIAAIIERITEAENVEKLIDPSKGEIVLDQFSLLRQGATTLVVAPDEDSNGAIYLMLLDIIAIPSRAIAPVSLRDPQVSPAINPLHNAQLNPRYNAQLNPQHNAQINPRYNAQLNPQYNAQINPLYNAQLNPRYNSQINPRYNPSIDPKLNPAINPSRNPGFSGLWIYDLKARRTAFVVKAGDKVILIYSLQNELLQIGAPTSHGYSVFKPPSEWQGYWVSAPSPDDQPLFLTFDKQGQWTGFVV